MESSPKTEFGKLLQMRRKYMQLTQAALAKQIAVSPILISYYERGHRTPRYETAQKIATVLRLEGEDRERFLSSIKYPAESSPDINDLGRVGQKGVVTKSVTNQEIERNSGVE